MKIQIYARVPTTVRGHDTGMQSRDLQAFCKLRELSAKWLPCAAVICLLLPAIVRAQGTVNPGTARDLASYPANGTTVGDSGIAAGNVATLTGNDGFTGNVTSTKLNNTIYVDGLTHTGAQALQSAIQACSGATACVVDARNPLIGTQTFTTNPFSGLNMPITLLTGPYLIQWDASTIGVDLPANLTWTGGGTTVTSSTANDPVFYSLTGVQYGLLTNRLNVTTASATNGNTNVTVASAAQAQVGGIIGIVAATGAGTSGVDLGQNTTLNNGGNVGVGDTSFIVTSGAYFSYGPSQYVLIDSEIIGVTSISTNTFTVTRGQLGTTAAGHTNGTAVYAVPTLVTEITAISGTTITLADTPTFSVTGALCLIGANNITLNGDLTLDGNYHNRSIAASGNLGLSGSFMVGLIVGPNVKFQYFGHGGVFVGDSRYSYIQGQYRHLGRPAQALGSDIWLFGKASFNKIDTIIHEDGDGMLMIDDRSTAFSLYGGASSNNTANLGPMSPFSTYNFGVSIEGYSSYNTVKLVNANVANVGVQITSSGQWPNATPVPTANRVDYQYINSSSVAAFTTGYPLGSASYNLIIGQSTVGTVSIASGYDSILGTGAGAGTGSGFGGQDGLNGFGLSGNAGLFSMHRSAGLLAYPDIFGDGTHALVIAGKADGSGSVLLGGATAHLGATAGGDIGGITACSGGTKVLNFGVAFNSTPLIIVSDETTAGGGRVSAKSTTSFTVTCSGATDTFDYLVIGQPN